MGAPHEGQSAIAVAEQRGHITHPPIVTRSGLKIGAKYVAPPAPLSVDATQLQRALLRHRLVGSPEFVAQRTDQHLETVAQRRHKERVRRLARSAERFLPWIAGACIAMAVKGWL